MSLLLLHWRYGWHRREESLKALEVVEVEVQDRQVVLVLLEVEVALQEAVVRLVAVDPIKSSLYLFK